MPTSNKRFTISLTPDLEKALAKEKQKKFYASSQNEMIRTLLRKALEMDDSQKLRASI